MRTEYLAHTAAMVGLSVWQQIPRHRRALPHEKKASGPINDAGVARCRVAIGNDRFNRQLTFLQAAQYYRQGATLAVATQAVV